MTRVLAIDVGGRRIGLAISDPSRTLARPLSTLTISSAVDGVTRVADEIRRLERDDDGLASIVVGMPVRLDGSPSERPRALPLSSMPCGRTPRCRL
jgi:putative Holliday junction resolvase